MAHLSQNDRDIIARYPLSKSLDHLQEPLQEAEQNPYDGPLTDQEQRQQEAISSLLCALWVHKVARNLQSKIGNGDLTSKMLMLVKHVEADNFNYEHYRPLSQLVIKKASDVDIWSAVFELITTLSRITPPTSIPVSFDGTAITESSSSFQGSEEARWIIESEMFYEIKRCTYRDVDGFFEKYFEGEPWSRKSKAIYDVMNKQYRDGRWTDFPDPPDEDAVWDWLSRFQNKHLSDSRGILYTTEGPSELTGGKARRQLDLFVKRRGIEKSGKHDWKDVCVIGQLKRSKWPLKKILLQLTMYMRVAFAVQPTRRFIHGFFLHGTTMELWVFDRSGPYSSGEFDIHEEPEKFIRAIAGYTMMDDKELGLDILTELDGKGRFITISKDETGKENRLQLDESPFVKQSAIVSRGTTCFRSSDHANVVKFSWTSDKRPPEADHLRLAREKGVEGIAKLIGYQRITSISELRSGLTFSSPHQFQDDTERECLGDEGSSQISQLSRQDEAAQKPDEPAVSLYESGNNKYSNRVFGCLAIAPAGRALSEFTPWPQFTIAVSSFIRELLMTLRDAIKAHRSLHLKGNILHRDISENNIIKIKQPNETGGFTGMLIDLDLAKVIGSDPSGARHPTGTVEFMAIQVLLGIDHTYRHDLESFFYVLIWLCARRGWNLCGDSKGRPKNGHLTKWYSDDFEDIAQTKRSDMRAQAFENILHEFPTGFDPVKPLCRNIRAILFPLLKDGEIFEGTPPGPPEHLYHPIIEAFGSAIADTGSNQDS